MGHCVHKLEVPPKVERKWASLLSATSQGATLVPEPIMGQCRRARSDWWVWESPCLRAFIRFGEHDVWESTVQAFWWALQSLLHQQVQIEPCSSHFLSQTETLTLLPLVAVGMMCFWLHVGEPCAFGSSFLSLSLSQCVCMCVWDQCVATSMWVTSLLFTPLFMLPPWVFHYFPFYGVIS